MKKFCLLLTCLLFSGILFPQTQNKTTIKKQEQTQSLFRFNQIRNDYIKKNKGYQCGRWYNYASAVQELEGPEGNLLNREILFPDTTVLIKYSNGTGRPWIHSIAVALAPLSEVFTSDTELNLHKMDKINVDSILMFGYYRRHIKDDDIVDTLIVEVLQDLRYYEYFLGSNIQENFDTDSLFFTALHYDDYLNYKDPFTSYETPISTYKIPLRKTGTNSESDTTDNGINVFVLKCDKDKYYKQIHNGVAMTMRFKPGYSWMPNAEIINEDLNEFSFLSYEEQGTNTYNKYRDKFDMNSSMVVTSSSLYNKQDDWHGTYIPSYAFQKDYPYENHFVSFHLKVAYISDCDNGIILNENNSTNLSQNMPNPADNSTMITYELKKANEVNIVITDLTGKKVIEIKEGKQTSGVHNVNVNTSSLSNGFYFYTLNADNTSLTRKMIVNK